MVLVQCWILLLSCYGNDASYLKLQQLDMSIYALNFMFVCLLMVLVHVGFSYSRAVKVMVPEKIVRKCRSKISIR